MKFKQPEEYGKLEAKIAISARISPEARDRLKKAAKRAKTTVSRLAANVLEDYAKFLGD